jgi:hypothetical protein
MQGNGDRRELGIIDRDGADGFLKLAANRRLTALEGRTVAEGRGNLVDAQPMKNVEMQQHSRLRCHRLASRFEPRFKARGRTPSYRIPPTLGMPLFPC